MGCPKCLRKSGDSSGGGQSKTLAAVQSSTKTYTVGRKKLYIWKKKKKKEGIGDLETSFLHCEHLFSVEELGNNQFILEMYQDKL